MAETKESLLLGEKMFIYKLNSGLSCYIIPKKGYVEKQAMLSVHYGSLDNSYMLDGKRADMPAGIAHFLEHKLFEDEKRNVFDQFSRLGGDVNAFTNFTTTAYYFTGDENFDKCLKLLIDFVFSPYFTDANVEKEKGIISQEINMYNDDPGWLVYFNMLKALYKEHPARENIAGSVESIRSITKDMLYDCYNSFYTPANMVMVCVGDFDEQAVVDLVERNVPHKENHNIQRLHYTDREPKEVSQAFVSQKMGAMPSLFNIGFKEGDFLTGYPEKATASKIALELLAGDGSELYNRLISQGLVDEGFYVEYMGNLSFGTGIAGGTSIKPQLVYQQILEEAGKLKEKGINPGDFERIKKKETGRFARIFNSINSIARGQTDAFMQNTDLIWMFDSIKNMEMSDVEKRIKDLFKPETAGLSVIE